MTADMAGHLGEVLDGVTAGGPRLVPATPPSTAPTEASVNHQGKFGDASLAQQLATDALLGRFRWSAGLKWLRWDGRRWTPCPDAAVVEAARQWAQNHVNAAGGAFRGGEDPDGAEVKGWLAVAKAAGRIRGIVGLGQGVAGVLTDAAAFDSEPDLLNAANGVVDLRTSSLHAASPALMMTKAAGAEYLPGATHPDWDAAVSALPAVERAWLQVRLGQAITGHMTPDDVLVVCQGSGENGKSTVFDGIRHALGDYHTFLSDRVLLANPDAHPTELMDLRGARLATLEETPEARRLNVARLKKVVGTSVITARRIRADPVTFAATHTVFVTTNYRPVVEETDHGTWRRLALLPFPITFRKPHQLVDGPLERPGDPGLKYRVNSDPKVWAAALAWLVEGARQWYAAGRMMPTPPASVDEATRQWRKEADLVLAYWDERLVPDPSAHVTSADLLSDFNLWLLTHGHRVWSDRLLTPRFGEHDETQRHRVVKQQRYLDPRTPYALAPVLSRPATQLPQSVVSTRYWAWLGLRFGE